MMSNTLFLVLKYETEKIYLYTTRLVSDFGFWTTVFNFGIQTLVSNFGIWTVMSNFGIQTLVWIFGHSMGPILDAKAQIMRNWSLVIVTRLCLRTRRSHSSFILKFGLKTSRRGMFKLLLHIYFILYTVTSVCIFSTLFLLHS